MIKADSVFSTPPTNSSAIDAPQSTIESPTAGNSPSPFEDVDLALLRFVRCLIRFGLTLDEAGAVVSGELESFRPGAIKKQRRRLVLIGMRLVPMPV
jgi:hypothetical protein